MANWTEEEYADFMKRSNKLAKNAGDLFHKIVKDVVNEYPEVPEEKPKKNKYNAQKTVIDGIEFDSKKEAARYAELKLLEKSWAITSLELQVKFILVPKQTGEREASYIADFVYRENGKTIVEDVKSKATKTAVYILKRKLMKWLYPDVEFREVE